MLLRVSCNTNAGVLLRRNQGLRKTKKEAAEYAQLLAKGMEEAKEKRRDRLPRERLSSPRAPTSKSESSLT